MYSPALYKNPTQLSKQSLQVVSREPCSRKKIPAIMQTFRANSDGGFRKKFEMLFTGVTACAILKANIIDCLFLFANLIVKQAALKHNSAESE